MNKNTNVTIGKIVQLNLIGKKSERHEKEN